MMPSWCPPSYYPLHPALEDVALDSELWEAHARLTSAPHLLVTPSDLKAFVKVTVHKDEKLP